MVSHDEHWFQQLHHHKIQDGTISENNSTNATYTPQKRPSLADERCQQQTRNQLWLRKKKDKFKEKAYWHI
jgi:hypothetical protein